MTQHTSVVVVISIITLYSSISEFNPVAGSSQQALF